MRNALASRRKQSFSTAGTAWSRRKQSWSRRKQSFSTAGTAWKRRIRHGGLDGATQVDAVARILFVRQFESR